MKTSAAENKSSFITIIKKLWKSVRNFFKKDCCKVLLFLFSLSFIAKISFAQHDMPGMNMQHDSMDMSVDSTSMEMTSSFSPNLPMNRDGSGTSWQPDANPMMMYMKMKGKTTYMFHGFLFIRYNMQDITNESDRGGNQFDAPNMFMFMLDH